MGTMNGTAVADLDAVQVFAQVVQSGGFTAAARRLGLPKSSVSRRVSELEARLGVRLLQRTTRKVALTDVGEVYYARAERALGDLRDAEAALADLRDAPRGVLRVTAPVDVGHELLARMVADFTTAYPEVSVVLDLDNRRVDLVAEGYDLALRATARLDDSSLVARRLITAHHRLFASASYVERRGLPAEPSELPAHDVLLFRGERLRQRLRLQRGDERAEVEVRSRFSSNDLGFLRRAVQAGLGIAMLPTFVCRRDVDHGDMRVVLPEWHLGSSAMHAVYPSSRHLSPKVRAFIEHAAKHFDALAR